MSAAAGGADFYDGRAAARAGPALAAENLGEAEVAAALALVVDIIAVGGAALFDG